MNIKHKMQELQELAFKDGPLCVGLDTDPSYLPESVIKAVGSKEEAVTIKKLSAESPQTNLPAAAKFRLHTTRRWGLKV